MLSTRGSFTPANRSAIRFIQRYSSIGAEGLPRTCEARSKTLIRLASCFSKELGNLAGLGVAAQP